MTRFQINFVLLANARNIFGIRVASLKMFTYNLRLRKFHSQGDVTSLEIQRNGNLCIFAAKFINKLVVFQFW